MRDLTGHVNGSQVQYVTFDRTYTNEAGISINIGSGVDYKVAPRVELGIRAGIIGDVTNRYGYSALIGTLTALGAQVSYRF
ncbi:hypothetical protein [Spirosoma montaniterrae]|uniref:hypothetical protein n=1 Tax=Spirosoma montaniterrae TaxID=1178516 RepID=UPI0012FA6029|nr:hypothetical protein [Spirosoma montaniterrae]